MNCSSCGRTLPAGVCECRKPFEDEYILKCLNGLTEEMKFPGSRSVGELVDKYCCVITAYMWGRMER
jgi:hypothetical protein